MTHEVIISRHGEEKSIFFDFTSGKKLYIMPDSDVIIQDNYNIILYIPCQVTKLFHRNGLLTPIGRKINVILKWLEFQPSQKAELFCKYFDKYFSVYDWYTEKQKQIQELPGTISELFDLHMAEVARMDIEREEWRAYQEWLKEHKDETMTDKEFEEEEDKLYCPF